MRHSPVMVFVRNILYAQNVAGIFADFCFRFIVQHLHILNVATVEKQLQGGAWPVLAVLLAVVLHSSLLCACVSAQRMRVALCRPSWRRRGDSGRSACPATRTWVGRRTCRSPRSATPRMGRRALQRCVDSSRSR